MPGVENPLEVGGRESEFLDGQFRIGIRTILEGIDIGAHVAAASVAEDQAGDTRLCVVGLRPGVDSVGAQLEPCEEMTPGFGDRQGIVSPSTVQLVDVLRARKRRKGRGNLRIR